MSRFRRLYLASAFAVALTGLVGATTAASALVLSRPTALQCTPANGLFTEVRGGAACCRTTLRCVRSEAGRCKARKLVTQSVCPGVSC